jgi:GNAT superfamily N-acetyltransferase
MMDIRKAAASDADDICEVLRRSITELCAADHRNDPALLAPWLANKTPETVRVWIGNAHQRLLVAVDGGKIVGAAAADEKGEIILNYVSPDARFIGASKALLAELEDWLRDKGHAAVTLKSTQTAHQFYLALGYRDDGTLACQAGGVTCRPLRKNLSA